MATSFVMLGIFFLLMLLQSRTAVLATSVGFLYISYPFLRSWYTKQKILFIGFSVLALLLVGMAIFVKTGSTAGRSFIWQNCFLLLRRNWITGVGFGRFNPEYNHLQANYFYTHSIVDSVALRANDGYYAFNEWLQVWIETGVLGFLIFSAFTVFILFICIKKAADKKQFYGAILIPLLAACMFSYPLHNIILLITGISFSLVAILNYFKTNKKLKKYLFLILAIVTIAIGIQKIRIEKQVNRIREESEEGFMTEAYTIFKTNLSLINKDYRLSSMYIDILYNTGRTAELLNEFPKIHYYHCNQALHTTMAKAYNEIHDSINARKHFLTALYISPYRLQSRMDLLEFYKNIGNIPMAKFWANQILDCPMKIITTKGILLKKKAEAFLTSK